ncbi:MAG: RimK family alpha-L-glutamate ligase [Promethearchaeati archaeon SRVP18_Atabeyarchaeia-1]
MKIGVVYGRLTGIWPTKMLTKSIEKLGHTSVLFSLHHVTAMVGGGRYRVKDQSAEESPRFLSRVMILDDLSAAMVRTLSYGTLDQITYRISLLEHMEMSGILVVNPAYSFRRARDKYAALFYLEKYRIPVPKTYVTESLRHSLNVVRSLGDVVIKPLVGARGEGSIRTNDVDVAYRALKAAYSVGQVLYIQEYIPKPDRDIRAFVVGNEVVSAMYRVALPGAWKTNVAQQGKPIKCELSREMEDIAVKASNALGLEYSGVDIMESQDGPVITEVNAAPTWHGLQSVTSFDIADRIIQHVIGKVKK